jgi:hypothetical protein
LEQGIVLIDTPGVGSTFRHNTEKAEAVLPECDAALFVVSPDPPITEVEVSYLTSVKTAVARLIIVLNKIDAIEAQDLATAAAFLRRVLAEKAGVDGEVPVFSISARAALLAKISDNPAALASSGLPELEAHLRDFLAHDKRRTLETAIARKAVGLGDDMLMETEIRLQALRLPLKELDDRIGTIEAAMIRFDDERRLAHDLLAGDRRRMLEQIETDADELRRRARTALEAALDQALRLGDDVESARAAVLATVSPLFEAELRRTGSSFQEKLARILDVHRNRIKELNELVRRTAADVMNVIFRAAEDLAAFEFRREPYWVTSNRIDMASPIPPGMFDRFLPGSVRKARVRRRLLQEIDTIVRRNVENLRWATRQNVEDAFRRYDAELEETLTSSIDATRNVVMVARDRRLNQADRVETEIAAVEASAAALSDIQAALRGLA